MCPNAPIDGTAALLEAARQAFARRDWIAARDGFNAARDRGALTADDVFAQAESAWWLGHVDESLSAYEAAYRLYLGAAQPRLAAMSALPLGYTLMLRGEGAQGSGWLSRAVRLLQDEPESAEHGYFVFLDCEAALVEWDLETAMLKTREAQRIGRQFADPNLIAMGILGEGRVLVRQGRVSEGMAMLDEAMLAALSDELEPVWAGNIYCHLMDVCHELGDLRRAGEWTQAVARWCESLPGAGPFIGVCRVHRAQVLHVQGAWEQAEHEVLRVCREMAHFDVEVVAEAHYQLGEIRRQRGDLQGAEESYRDAHRSGRDPQPGLALLRLAQGHIEAASASIEAALAAKPRDRLARVRLCEARVEIALASGDIAIARAASAELDELAGAYGSSGLEAAALHARGAVLLAEGQFPAAIQTLRAAWTCLRESNATYEAARVRVLLARGYTALADRDAAALELDAAGTEFNRLGALADARKVADIRRGFRLPGGLTEREAEVLALVAAGKTNREIAGGLVISEKTVARHLSNIFTKLGVTSRTAAAAYAFEHGLVHPRAGGVAPRG